MRVKALFPLLCLSWGCGQSVEEFSMITSSNDEFITIPHQVNGSARYWVELEKMEWKTVDFVGTYNEKLDRSNPCIGCPNNVYWVFRSHTQGQDTITFYGYSKASDTLQLTDTFRHVMEIR